MKTRVLIALSTLMLVSSEIFSQYFLIGESEFLGKGSGISIWRFENGKVDFANPINVDSNINGKFVGYNVIGDSLICSIRSNGKISIKKYLLGIADSLLTMKDNPTHALHEVKMSGFLGPNKIYERNLLTKEDKFIAKGYFPEYSPDFNYILFEYGDYKRVYDKKLRK